MRPILVAACLAIAAPAAALSQEPLSRQHCEALRDGLMRHARMQQAAARVAQAMALAEIMMRDDALLTLRAEVSALGDVVKSPGLMAASRAFAAICTAE